jgi:hypothetical protein
MFTLENIFKKPIFMTENRLFFYGKYGMFMNLKTLYNTIFLLLFSCPLVFAQEELIELPEVEVVASELVEESHKTILDPVELTTLPGSEGDPLKAIFSLPGIVSANEAGGNIYMRGSGAQENHVRINNMPAYYLYHWGGIRSIINPELVEDFEVYMGGFPARFGNALGGIIDIKLRPPETDRMHYNYHIGLLDSSMLIEGPLDKEKKHSFYLSGRRSYIDAILSKDAFNDLMGEEDDAAIVVPRFFDLQAQYRYQSIDGQVNIQFLAAGDTLGFLNKDEAADPEMQGEFNIDTDFKTLGLNWEQDWNPDLRQNFTISFSNYSEKLEIGTDLITGEPFYVNNKSKSCRLNPELFWWYSATTELSGGLIFEYWEFPVDLYIGVLPSENDLDPGKDFTSVRKYRVKKNLYANYIAPYFQYQQSFTDRFTSVFGLRYSAVKASNQIDMDGLSPRIKLEYAISNDTQLFTTLGKFYQVPAGYMMLDDFGNPYLKYTRADHYIGGISHLISNKWSVKTELYYKEMDNLVVQVNDLPPDNYANEGNGYAHGLDLFIKREAVDKKTGWLTYSYLKTKRKNRLSGKSADFAGDQPHTLILVWSQPFSRTWYKWKWGVKFETHSGRPYTPVIGRKLETLANGVQRWQPVYGEFNSRRYPIYYKLDIRVDYQTEMKGMNFSFYLDLQNVMMTRNVVGYDYGDEYEDFNNPDKITTLPFLPYFGVEFRF